MSTHTTALAGWVKVADTPTHPTPPGPAGVTARIIGGPFPAGQFLISWDEPGGGVGTQLVHGDDLTLTSRP